MNVAESKLGCGREQSKHRQNCATYTSGTRVRGGGGTSLQVTPPSNPATATQRGLNVADSKLPASSTS